MKKKIALYIESCLISKLLKDNGGIEKKDIDKEKRKINLGLGGMGLCWFSGFHKLMLYLLVKCYSYKCYTEELVFNTCFDKIY
jgi:hypothetical protein